MLTTSSFSISATDWLEESDEPSWTSDDTVRYAAILAEHGVDLLDISSGGNSPHQKIRGGPGYQVPLAEAVKKAHSGKIFVSAVGSITTGKQAQQILENVRDLLDNIELLVHVSLAVTGPGRRYLCRTAVPKESWYSLGFR